MTAPGAMLLVVHGEPGAGKSTLARALGRELGLPVLDRDGFKDAMFDTLGWNDREWSAKVGAASWEMMRLCLEQLIGNQVSMIAESNFRPGDPLVRQVPEWCAAAEVLPMEIYCTATPEVLWERFESRRARGDRHPGHVGFPDQAAFTAALDARPHGPLQLGGPLLTIHTDKYWPDIPTTISWINDNLPR